MLIFVFCNIIYLISTNISFDIFCYGLNTKKSTDLKLREAFMYCVHY